MSTQMNGYQDSSVKHDCHDAGKAGRRLRCGVVRLQKVVMTNQSCPALDISASAYAPKVFIDPCIAFAFKNESAEVWVLAAQSVGSECWCWFGCISSFAEVGFLCRSCGLARYNIALPVLRMPLEFHQSFCSFMYNLRWHWNVCCIADSDPATKGMDEPTVK